MAFDISQILKQQPIGVVDTKAGKLLLYSMTVSAQIELKKDIQKPIDQCEPIAYLRKLAKYICFPDSSVDGGKERPKEVILSDEDTYKLSDEDLENIAKLYLSQNDYLYHESVRKTSPIDGGGTGVTIKKGDIKYPKLEGESDVLYLHRLSGIEEHRQEELISGITFPFRHFSANLNKNLKETFTMGETLKQSINTVRPSSLDSYVTKIPNIDIAALARQKEERQLKPIREMASKLDKLIELSSLASDFMVKTNELQAGIAEELKESGDKAAVFSKANLFLTIVVIVLTIFSISFSIFVYYQARNDSIAQTKQTDRYVTSITSAISNLYKKPERSHGQIKEVTPESLQLEMILKELRMQRNQNTKKLELLEKQVTELRAKVPTPK
jgi:hypothetical protein